MVTKESAYKKISELVQRFEEQYASYKNSDYNMAMSSSFVLIGGLLIH